MYQVILKMLFRLTSFLIILVTCSKLFQSMSTGCVCKNKLTGPKCDRNKTLCVVKDVCLASEVCSTFVKAPKRYVHLYQDYIPSLRFYFIFYF